MIKTNQLQLIIIANIEINEENSIRMLYDLAFVKYETSMDTNDEPGVIVAHLTATLYLHSRC